MDDNKDTKKRNKKLLVILIIILFISISSFLLISIKVPYTAQFVYNEKEPYTDTEYYWVEESVKTPYRDCIKSNWLTGKCTAYSTFYYTEYQDVKKERTVTKYRTVEKIREETRYCNLWKKIVGKC